MKRRIHSRFLQQLPGLLLRLSSVWLLASFASFYFGASRISFQLYSLLWPGLFFVVSLAFSLVLYFVDEKGPSAPTKAEK